MGKKLTKKETLGLILSEVAKLRNDVKALEKQLAERAKPAAKQPKAEKKPAAKADAQPKAGAQPKKGASPRRPVLVQADTPPARSAG